MSDEVSLPRSGKRDSAINIRHVIAKQETTHCTRCGRCQLSAAGTDLRTNQPAKRGPYQRTGADARQWRDIARLIDRRRSLDFHHTHRLLVDPHHLDGRGMVIVYNDCRARIVATAMAAVSVARVMAAMLVAMVTSRLFVVAVVRGVVGTIMIRTMVGPRTARRN